jgi:hypothetical protein
MKIKTLRTGNRAIHYQPDVMGKTACGYFIDVPGTSFTHSPSIELVDCSDCLNKIKEPIFECSICNGLGYIKDFDESWACTACKEKA